MTIHNTSYLKYQDYRFIIYRQTLTHCAYSCWHYSQRQVFIKVFAHDIPYRLQCDKQNIFP